MNIQEWLEQVQKLDQLINAKVVERDQFMALATSVSSGDMDGMPHAKGNISDPVGNAGVKLAMMANDIDQLIDRYIEIKQDVVSMLERLPEKQYGVLHRYYIRYMTWDEVAEDMGYCTTQIWRIKKEAFKNLEDAIECNIHK